MKHMTIGQLAKASKLRPDTIRYYESLKLIEPVNRSDSGYRLYNESSMEHIVFIKRAKSLGFKLSEVKSLLEIHLSDSVISQDILDLTKAKIEEAQRNIEDLIAIKRALEDLAKKCPGGDTPIKECPIVSYLHARHDNKGV